MAKGEVGNKSLTEGISGGQSDKFWTTGRQSANGPNLRCVFYNYSFFIFFWLLFFKLQVQLIRFLTTADRLIIFYIYFNACILLTLFFSRFLKIPLSIHSRCGKCAKYQIFGTFATPNTKMELYEMCQISKIIQHGYSTVVNLQRYG